MGQVCCLQPGGESAIRFPIMSERTRPNTNLMNELRVVAREAQTLFGMLGSLNQPLPPDFPDAQLKQMCGTLMLLQEGTTEGCEVPLRQARVRRRGLHIRRRRSIVCWICVERPL